MRIPDILNPNKQLSTTAIWWYVVALLLMGTAIIICLSMNWQTDGLVKAVYEGGRITSYVVERAPNRFSIVPHVTSAIWAFVIYGALLARRYVRNISNLPTLLLVFCNVFFIASLIEAFLPAEEIPLFNVFILKDVDMLKFSPQKVLLLSVLLAWIGMRALSGLAIVLLGIAFLSRTQELNMQLGMFGTCYVLCGLFSFLIQARLPYMMPEGGWYMTLLQDFGMVRTAAVGNIQQLERNIEQMGRVGGVRIEEYAAGRLRK